MFRYGIARGTLSLVNRSGLKMAGHLSAIEGKPDQRRAYVEHGLAQTIAGYLSTPAGRLSGVVAAETARATLGRIPVTRKADVRRSPENYLAPGWRHAKVRPVQTSGSTGAPLRFYRDPFQQIQDFSNGYRGKAWHDIMLGTRVFHVWGDGTNGWKRLTRAGRNVLLNRTLYPAGEVNQVTAGKLGLALSRASEAVLLGYPSAIAEFARYILASMGRIDSVQAAVVTGEMLQDHQVAQIQRTFSCNIVVEYGLSEVGIVAYSCENGTMHIFDDTIHVEILDDEDRPCDDGAVGRIVVTPLYRSVVPLVRYDTGDLGAIDHSRCECGRPFPVLTALQGRAGDVIWTTLNEPLPPNIVSRCLRTIPNIAEYSAHQSAVGRLQVSYVQEGSEEPPKSYMAAVERCLTNGLEGAIHVTFTKLDSIPRSRAGKHRWISSDVNQNV